MEDTEHISELLLRWEQLRSRSVAPTLDELCADCPELAEELGRQIRIIEQMEGLLGVSSASAGKRSQETIQLGNATNGGERDDALPYLSGYELLEVLGRGGMGVVYLARQRDLDRTVAIKMIDRAIPGSTQLNRFRDEARAIARLHHPNIVQIFDFGEEKNIPFFSMEFVDGGNLQSSIDAESLSSNDTAELIEKVARAVHRIHKQGFVHRDLKPANILLTSEGEPKVTDFGLAKELDRSDGHTRSGEILGTLSYMAPEQVDHTFGDVDPRTDVYALGAILYEALTGLPPFTGTPAALMQKVLHQQPKMRNGSSTNVPVDLQAIALKCLEKYPPDRYRSAEDFADDLRRFLDHKPIRARRLGAVRRVIKWTRRHRQMVALAVGLVFVAAMAVPIVNSVRDYQAHERLRTRAITLAPQVRGILQQHCYECHGADVEDIKEELDILDHALLLSSERTIIVPGKPDDSRLIQRIADGSMPPEELEKELPRISQEELTVLKEWILGGAPSFADAETSHALPPVAPHSALAEQVKQIFIKRCYRCHKYDEAKGGIKILHHRLLVHVRKVVVPGKPDDSDLFQLLTSEDDERRMPPPAKHAGSKPTRLSQEEIDKVRRWIANGAPPFPKST